MSVMKKYMIGKSCVLQYFFSQNKNKQKNTQKSADYISCPPPSHTHPPNSFVRKKRLSALCKSKLWKNKTMCMICTCRHILSPPREWKLKNLEKMWLRTEDSCQFFVPFKKIFNIFYVIKRLYVLWRINLVAVSRNCIIH